MNFYRVDEFDKVKEIEGRFNSSGLFQLVNPELLDLHVLVIVDPVTAAVGNENSDL
jgi:hypothetical protein